MKAAAVLLLACAATACGDRHEPVARTPPTTVAPPPADVRVTAAFLGRWAPAPAACANGGYVFTPDDLTAPDGMVCRFRRVHDTAAGWTIDTVCSPDDTPRTVTLDRVAGGLRLEIRGRPAVTIQLCPDGQPPAPPA